MSSRYAIGIDLGTTNSVLACADLQAPHAVVEAVPVPQLVAAGTVESRPLLPSFLYLGTPDEQSQGALRLPWSSTPDSAVGEWARRQGADVPDRTVAAAKSWLAYSAVDRRAAILPWDAPATVPKVSPVEASRRYLRHLADAWDHAHPDAPLADQRVVLTVPASFDAAARELTREAALQAGLPATVVLLEEPQAAFHAWLADRTHDWRRQVREGDVILICDVGGGTTDFSLVGVAQEAGDLALRRLAVGQHILVGGDNMDLALARQAQELFAAKDVALDAWQSVALWHACRTAKETLLAAGGPKNQAVAVLGRGRRLIGRSQSVQLDRDQVVATLLDGFLPHTSAEAVPEQPAAAGFHELGLPYATDPAITRHLAAFLGQQGDVRPTHVLFNGGVFKSEPLRQRLLEVLTGWYGAAAAPRLLAGNTDFDLAVARGAAYYGHACQHQGIRIRGGSPRAYYVGIEASGPAVPGARRPLRQVCVAPLGMEEGTELDVPGPAIGLLTGTEAKFRFFSSTTRHDLVGTPLAAGGDHDLQETDTLAATLPAAGKGLGERVPVRFVTRLTELGVLELWCVSTNSDRRWKLEFCVRNADAR